MATTKNPLIRYKILDACFRNPYKKYYIETLLEMVNDKLFETSGESSGIQLRQLREDIAFMRSPEGWSIELADLKDGKKKIYRYGDLDFSIKEAPLNELELQVLQSTIQVLSQFEGMPQFEGIQAIVAKLKNNLKADPHTTPFIGFDSNQDLKGIEYFSQLYHAVQHQTPLQITYQDFNSPKPYTFVFHPYYLKEYNNRWFLFGMHAESGKMDWNVAIDRIVAVENSSEPFYSNDEIDWQDYFSDMIGVSKSENAPIETIVLHFNKQTGKYMENKSIHETQKHRWIDEETFEVQIKVILNYELERLILSYGESVTVMEPQHLIETLKNRLLASLTNY